MGEGTEDFCFCRILSFPGLYTTKKFSCVGEELFVLEVKEANMSLKEG